jgi:hypothetical protein
MRRLPSLLLALLAALALSAAPAHAATPPDAVQLGVSLPADAVQAKPGDHIQLAFAVANAGDNPLRVRLAQRQVRLGDNGTITMLSVPDPTWAPATTVPSDALTVPAHRSLTIAVPTVVPALSPDVYLVGFEVTTVPLPGNTVHVLTSVGAYVPVDVPGPRDRRLHATLRAPRVVWGAATELHLDVANAGKSSLYFWGDEQGKRIDKAFLPAGHHRTIPVAVHHAMGLGSATSHVFYNRADNQVVEAAVARPRILFLPPTEVLIIAAMVVALLVLGAAFRGRRRRAGTVAAAATTPTSVNGRVWI